MRRLLLALLLLLLPGVAEAQTQWQINNLLSMNSCGTQTTADILGVDQGGPTFGLAGNVAAAFQFGTVFTISQSAGPQPVGNDGVWTVASVTTIPFPFPAGQTLVTVNRSIPSVTQPFGRASVGGGSGGSCSGTPITYVRDFDSIQAAINATTAGGIVQLDCTTYNVSSSITISAALTIQGCGPGGMAPFGGSTGTQVNGASGISVFDVNGQQGVVFRDFVINAGTNGIGVLLHCVGAPCTNGQVDPSHPRLFNNHSQFRSMWIQGGDYGIVGGATAGQGESANTWIVNSYINSQAVNGVWFQGQASVTPSTDKCDGGGTTIIGSTFEGNGTSGSVAIRLTNNGASTIIGNSVISWGAGVLRVDAAGCQTPNPASPDPTQYQITGNQFEGGVASGAYAILFTSSDGGFGNIFIGNNYLNSHDGPTMAFTTAGGHSTFNLTITGNNIRQRTNQNSISINNGLGVTITGNAISHDSVTTTAASLTGNAMSITGNAMRGGNGTITNGFALSGGTMCQAGNTFSSVTNKFTGDSSTSGC